MEEVENILNNGIKIILLFTPFSVTRFASTEFMLIA